MNWLADNALAIWMGGMVALTLAVVVFLQTRSGKALASIAAVVTVAAVLLLVEHLLETPREAVERALYRLAATVEANDIEGTLAFLAPSAQAAVSNEVQRKMPMVEIELANVIGSPQIDVAPDGKSATVQCRGRIVATIKSSGLKGGGDDELTIDFIRDGERWLVEGYTSKHNWNRALGR